MFKPDHANYHVVDATEDRVVIQDDGPWHAHPTITNDAEWVVSQIAPDLRGRRLMYIDSEGEMDELLVNAQEEFIGFRTGSCE